MIVIEGTIRVGDVDRARPQMEAMIGASRRESGCIDYAYAVDLLDPCLIRISERWQDREALKHHLKTPHLQKWRASWPALDVRDRSLRMYEAEPEDF